MSRRMLGILCCLCLLMATSFAGDQVAKSADNDDSSSANRDANAADVRGIPKRHRYPWAVVGGAALGAGIGALLPPGSGKSAAKGLLIGGGLASFLYLSGHKNDPEKNRAVAWIISNAVLAGGVGWAICNCGKGFPIGALIGGGFTGAVQAFAPRHHPTLTKITGATPAPPQQQTPPPQPQEQQAPPPPQPQQQIPPPPPPQTPPPQSPPPQEDQLLDDQQIQQPQTAAENLPDSPQPNYRPDLPPLEERL